jgi:hypothetical protein
LLPVEQLYLQAVSGAESAPNEAVAKLQSIVDLYGPNAGKREDAETAAVVRLANRRLEALRAQVAEQRERQLESLKERLAAAAQLSETNPRRAAAMYRAIIELHANDAWAENVVAEARSRLREREKTSHEP